MASKQVLVIRREIGMRRGKEGAQLSHAAGEFLLQRIAPQIIEPGMPQRVVIDLNGFETAWFSDNSHTKIVLQANTEDELRAIAQLCGEAGIENHLIVDAGKTEFKGVPTVTALGIGPHAEEEIDKITGPQGICPLKLY